MFPSLAGNLLGSLAMVAVVQAAGIYSGNSAAAVSLAIYKTSHTFTEARTAIIFGKASVYSIACGHIMASGAVLGDCVGQVQNITYLWLIKLYIIYCQAAV